MAHGGSRPGAGRKPGSKTKARKVEIVSLAERMHDHVDDAIAALSEICRTGQSESARTAAANAILDRVYGKARQAVEVTGADGGPLQTEDVTHDAAAFARRMAGLAAGTVSGRDGAPAGGDQGGA